MAGAVSAAQAGDRDALHLLYVRYAAEVRRSLGSLVEDRHEAEAITRGVFLELGSSIKRYEPREGPFLAWLLREHVDAVAGPSVRLDLAS